MVKCQVYNVNNKWLIIEKKQLILEKNLSPYSKNFLFLRIALGIATSKNVLVFFKYYYSIDPISFVEF